MAPVNTMTLSIIFFSTVCGNQHGIGSMGDHKVTAGVRQDRFVYQAPIRVRQVQAVFAQQLDHFIVQGNIGLVEYLPIRGAPT